MHRWTRTEWSSTRSKVKQNRNKRQINSKMMDSSGNKLLIKSGGANKPIKSWGCSSDKFPYVCCVHTKFVESNSIMFCPPLKFKNRVQLQTSMCFHAFVCHTGHSVRPLSVCLDSSSGRDVFWVSFMLQRTGGRRCRSHHAVPTVSCTAERHHCNFVWCASCPS